MDATDEVLIFTHKTEYDMAIIWGDVYDKRSQTSVY